MAGFKNERHRSHGRFWPRPGADSSSASNVFFYSPASAVLLTNPATLAPGQTLVPAPNGESGTPNTLFTLTPQAFNFDGTSGFIAEFVRNYTTSGSSGPYP